MKDSSLQIVNPYEEFIWIDNLYDSYIFRHYGL